MLPVLAIALFSAGVGVAHVGAMKPSGVRTAANANENAATSAGAGPATTLPGAIPSPSASPATASAAAATAAASDVVPAPRHYVVGIPIFDNVLPLEPTTLFEGISITRLSVINSPLLTSSNASARTQATFETVLIGASRKPVAASLGTTITPVLTFDDVKKAHKASGAIGGVGKRGETYRRGNDNDDDNGNDNGKGNEEADADADKGKPPKVETKAKKLDIMLVPGGLGASPVGPMAASDEVKAFVKWGAENVETVLTVCTGSWLLASTGALNGHKATTNKQAYQMAVDWNKNQTDIKVEWVPDARWVHEDDANIWTSSGVSAGMDMTAAFIEKVAGKAGAQEAMAFGEYIPNLNPNEDPFAVILS